MFNFLIIAFILLCLGLIGWHVFLAFVGGAVILAGGAWGFLVATVCIIAAAILGIFFFASLGIIILGLIIGLWTLIAILLFPVLFPILLPLFLLFLCVSLVRRRKE